MSIVNVVALSFVACGAIGLAWSVVQVIEARYSAGWPKTVATITHSWISREKTSEGDMFEANIAYRYFVDGREIIADRIRVGGRVSQSWIGPAERLVAKYPVGHGVTIAYDPEDTTQGVLEPGSTRSAWCLVAICVAWIAISLFALSEAI
jgi:hypothetical protein